MSLQFLVDFVEAIKGSPWAALAFVAVYAISCALWPTSAFPVAGGVLFGFWRGFLLNTLAANLGALIPFVIARKFGRQAVRRFLKGRFKELDEKAQGHGFWTVTTMRMVGFPPFLVANYALGLSGVRLRDYAAGTFLGMLTWSVALTYFADTLWGVVVSAGDRGFRQAAAKLLWPLTGGVLFLAAAAGLAAALRAIGKRRI